MHKHTYIYIEYNIACEPLKHQRNANEFKYVILVAILDFGLVQALLPRYRWKLYMSYILAPINCNT